MAFWGVEVKPGQNYVYQFNHPQRKRLHISQATLGVGAFSTSKISVQCNIGEKDPVLICSLIPNKSETCSLALEFEEEDDVTFSVLGPQSVYLTGFCLDNLYNDKTFVQSSHENAVKTKKKHTKLAKERQNTELENDSMVDVQEENIQVEEAGNNDFNQEVLVKDNAIDNMSIDRETECDPGDDDKDDHGNDFIEDGDIRGSTRPKNQVVIEGIVEDEKPAKVDGDSKCLEKNYQVSDSDGDAQKDIAKNALRILSIESDDEDGLPLSSIIKTKHQESNFVGNDQKQNIDKGGASSFELDKNEKHMPLSSVLNTKDGSIQEKSDKEEFMGNKTDEAHDDEDDQVTGIKRTIKGCEIESGAGCVRHDSEEKPKKKKKKRVIESQCARVENDIKVDVQEEENLIVEAKIDDTSKNELIKNQPVDNLYNDKETESDPGNDDKADNENDFIEDGDIPGSTRPKNQVVIEGILDDEKPAKVNGDSKCLEKSDSDCDAQKDIAKNNSTFLTIESDDEDGLPLASVMKTKHQESDSAGNEQKQNIDEGGPSSFDLDKNEKHMPLSSVLNANDGSIQKKSDKEEFMGNKTDEAGGNQVTGIKRTIEGCEIERGAGCVRHDSEEKSKKKKKRVIESQCAIVENDIKVDVQEEENFIVEAKIDDTSKNEPIKDQPVDNLCNDKTFVQSSHENAVKTKKKSKKHAKERQTTELGNYSKIDVQEENIQVEEAVINNAIDNISIDKGTKCIGRESEKLKKRKKKRGKESQNVGVENESKMDVQEEEICKIEAQIDDISKNEPVKDQINDDLSFDKAAVQSCTENDVKTNRSAKDRQTSNVGEDSMIGALKEEKCQVEVAAGNDINQEVHVKDNAIESDFNDNTEKHEKERQAGEIVDDSMVDIHQKKMFQVEEAGITDINQEDAVKDKDIEDVSDDKGVEKPKAEIEIQEKPTKKRKKRTKERSTNVVDNMCDAQKEAKSLIVKGKTDDITHEEPYKDKSIQLIGKKDVESDVKVKKKKKQRQTCEVADQSTTGGEPFDK